MIEGWIHEIRKGWRRDPQHTLSRRKAGPTCCESIFIRDLDYDHDPDLGDPPPGVAGRDVLPGLQKG